jgi:hypothetical protein
MPVVPVGRVVARFVKCDCLKMNVKIQWRWPNELGDSSLTM